VLNNGIAVLMFKNRANVLMDFEKVSGKRLKVSEKHDFCM
jgi:hypothetical protein